jgi:predicted ATP-dependent protease
LIGNFENYEVLYENDEDFKRIFPIKIEADLDVKYNENVRNYITKNIKEKINREKLLNISDDAIDEIIKFLVRNAGERNKISIDDYNINKLLYLSNNNAKEEERKKIEKQDVISVAYEEEKILEDILEGYKNKKILITTNGKKMGIINALSVVGTQTIAFSSKYDVKLLELSPEINNIEKIKRVLQRKMNRSRRSINPDKYNEDGTINIHNKDKWIKSNNYLKTQYKLKDIQRKQREIRKQSHNKLVNYILNLGNKFYVETMSYKGLQARVKKTTVNEKTGMYVLLF